VQYSSHTLEDPARRGIPVLALMRGLQLKGVDQFRFESDGIAHHVYRKGDRAHPPLLVMPEIAGLSPGLLLFIDRLVSARFQIYVPWLFGSVGRRAPVRNAVRLCISREFANLREGVSAPITIWLRALAAHISRENGDSRVGAIGMCLTGAFAIPLVIDPQVVAAVAAQPSVPLSLLHAAFGVPGGSRLGALNIAEEDIAQARARLASGEAHLFALRCRADRICPKEKIERLRQEFPVGLAIREYGEPHDRNRVGERPHATFTKEYRLETDANPSHHSRQALADLLAFFNRHLR
jgi:dienelactone hydrolase